MKRVIERTQDTVVTHVRDEHDPDIHHVHTVQDTTPIYEQNQRMRRENAQRDLSFGRRVGRVPNLDLVVLRKKYPDTLGHPDHQIQMQHWVKFFHTPEGEKYRTDPEEQKYFSMPDGLKAFSC